jgi:Kef-type K+ transport system membrane component KefB
MKTIEILPLAALGIIFLCGYCAGQLANRFKFPRVTGYIIAGILLSPSVSGIFSVEMVEGKFSIVTDMALAIIAYSIGGTLSLARLKQLRKSIFWINLTQSLGAFFVTFTAIALLASSLIRLPFSGDTFGEVYLPLALILGAVSVATAPAAILAIVHEYKAKGPLTTTLLAVVALDDGSAIILYALASTLVGSLVTMEGLSVYKMVAAPALIILSSITLGACFGFSLTTLTARIKRRDSLLVVILGHILLCAGIAEHLHLSPLLVNMTLGFFLINRSKQGHTPFLVVENIEEPLFALFFTLAGAHLDLTVLNNAGLMAILIVAARFSGKLMGTKLGARLTNAPEVVTKYLGYGLLPKAGVTVGLVLKAQSLFNPEVSAIMVNAVLASVIINELIAPPLVKFALVRSGEVTGGNL